MSTVLSLLLVRHYLKGKSFRSFVKKPLIWACGLGLLLSFGSLGLRQWALTHPSGVALDALTVRSGPGEHYVQLGLIPSGTEIRILSTSPESSELSEAGENWLQVRYSQDAIGWIKASGLLTL